MRIGKIYWIALACCLLGYFIIFQAKHQHCYSNSNSNIGFCIFKKITHIPCPACGTTRAVLFLMQGSFLEALMLNPLGFVVSGLLFLLPLWVVYDVALKKKTLEKKYHKMETFLKQKPIIILLITLIALNWIWNIKKNV